MGCSTMLEEVAKVFIVVATLSGMALAVGAMIRVKKSWTDWTLAGGAVLLTIGLGLTALAILDLSDWLQRHGVYLCLGCIGLGSVFFTMGFIMDQLRHRSIRRYRQQLAAMEQSAALLPPHTPAGDE